VGQSHIDLQVGQNLKRFKQEKLSILCRDTMAMAAENQRNCSHFGGNGQEKNGRCRAARFFRFDAGGLGLGSQTGLIR
jgi:hypothetical protein